MPYFLALAAAAFYGAADFLGGLATRRAPAVVVVVLSGGTGLAMLSILLPILPPAAATWGDIAWGGAAGLGGGIGVALLYKALAIGRMAAVAPTTALCAVAIPVLVGLLRGERPSPPTWAGMVLAFVAIVLVSQSRDDALSPSRRSSLGLALMSGVAIGLFYIAIAETSARAGLWPLMAARATSVLLFLPMVLRAGHVLRVERPLARQVVAAGLLDMTANVLYVFAAHGGLLSVVVTLSSLYPASTVLLARVVLRERLSGPQVAGVAAALVAVVLMVGGT